MKLEKEFLVQFQMFFFQIKYQEPSERIIFSRLKTWFSIENFAVETFVIVIVFIKRSPLRWYQEKYHFYRKICLKMRKT